MTGWVATFNLVCSMFYDGLVLVAGPLGKAFQAGLVGLLVGGVATAVFKRLINLPRLRSGQQLLLAALYESWLYRHEPRVVLVANGALLKANFAYLRTFLMPLAVGSLLVTPMVLQAHYHLGMRGIEPGKPVLLTAEFESVNQLAEDVYVEWLSGGGSISPPVRQPARQRAVWRIEPEDEGGSALMLRLRRGRERVDVPLFLSASDMSISSGSYGTVVDLLLSPRAGVLAADSGFTRVWVEYPSASLGWLGWLTMGSLVGGIVVHYGMETARRNKVARSQTT